METLKAIVRNRNDMCAFVDRCTGRLGNHFEDRYTIELKVLKATRSQEQNRYLWGVCYPTILSEGGEELKGWRKEDLHEYFLGEHFGWETLDGFGRKRIRPLQRSSTLSKMEFVDFVDFIQQKAAELGIVIPEPNSG